MKNNKILLIAPIMISFFAMGFVDIVGISTNYIKVDFNLSETVSSLLPSMVFLWFLVFSVPTGMLMNKIGRRKTVIISLFVTLLAMSIPMFGYSFNTMLLSFACLGIGNTLMQVSLNPLITNVVSGKLLASSLTLGQFVKAIASFLAPIIATWAAVSLGDWKLLYPIYGAISIVPIVWLFFTPIEETKNEGKTSGFKECFALLKNNTIIFLFVGILVHVGIDVGVNLSAPKILMERLAGFDLSEAGYAISIYFFARTIGCFSGAFILSLMSPRKFFIISVAILLLGVLGLALFHSLTPMYISIALLGVGNSNIFSMIFSQAMQLLPERNNEVSGLMIMGISGGAIFPIFMGLASDALGSQMGAIIIIAVCILYLVFLSSKIKKV